MVGNCCLQTINKRCKHRFRFPFPIVIKVQVTFDIWVQVVFLLLWFLSHHFIWKYESLKGLTWKRICFLCIPDQAMGSQTGFIQTFTWVLGDYTQVSTLVLQIFYSLSNLPLFNDQGNLTPLPYAHQYSLRNTVIDQCVKYCLLSWN